MSPSCSLASPGTWMNPPPIPPSLRRIWSAARPASKPPFCSLEWAETNYLPAIANTPRKLGRKLIKENGAQRIARSRGSLHSQLHLSRCDAEDEFIYRGGSESAPRVRPGTPASRRLRHRPRSRLPAPDALSRHQDFHGEPE